MVEGNMKRVMRLVLIPVLAAGLAGCATNGRVDKIEQKLNDVSSSADAANRKAEAAQKTADQALSRAQAAEAEAKSAAARADDAARTAEAIFKKRVSK
jgi:outer membrane murein-binding lipoprotein Lpp